MPLRFRWLCQYDFVFVCLCKTPRQVLCPACSTIQLVATRLIEAGEEVFISYGDRPLRDFLRGYAFTPTESAQGFEVGHRSQSHLLYCTRAWVYHLAICVSRS